MPKPTPAKTLDNYQITRYNDNMMMQWSLPMAVTVKPTNAANTAAIAAFLANKSVTIAPVAVAAGLRKTRYIARGKSRKGTLDNQG